MRERTPFGSLTRSELMSRIRSRRNRTTEEAMARLLREARLSGWRRHLPVEGRPDFAWTKRLVALFVHGCFWHGHGCGRDLMPRTNTVMWRQKIESNRARDRRVRAVLRRQGWAVLQVWECQLRRSPGRQLRRIARALGAAEARPDQRRL
ncbi:MAG: DNA mismatch endonuclease Vsr [Candidatus Aenigmarchaeota archaeon]|nr:DNA mismatch endonuclease Vsr [Candidatus Aenigmarchaeota archaeon]